MHRQAMLVSLSLSPATTAAKNDKHWAFLAEIDAPQWADLKAEQALAGTIGDDPWFYRSHLHHAVPLTELSGGQSADSKGGNAHARTPQIERKKRASSKTKLAFDGQTVAISSKCVPEDLNDSSPKAIYSSECTDTLGELPNDHISSPILCKSPERFKSSRRFLSSSRPDEYMGGTDDVETSDGLNLREDTFKNNLVNGQISLDSSQPVSFTTASGQSADCSRDESKPAPPNVPWLETIFPRLNDVRRLRKSLGSALRVKIDDSAEGSSSESQVSGTAPKSRLVHQSVQLETPAKQESSGSKTGISSCMNEKNNRKGTCEPDREGSDGNQLGSGLASRLGVNSSVHAFDDIRRMRKSWGSALRVKVTPDDVASEVSPRHGGHELSAISEHTKDILAKPLSSLPEKRIEESSLLGLDMRVLDIQGTLEGNVDSKINLVDNKVPEDNLSAVDMGAECITLDVRGETEELDVVDSLELCLPKVVAIASLKKYRRSISFDHVQGRVMENVFQSNSVQQKQGSRLTPIAHSHGPVDRFSKGNRPTKGGKENTVVQSPPKLKPSSGTSVAVAKKSRQSVMRMSMPSLTFTAHARAANGANGGPILKPSSNGVGEPSRAVSNKATIYGARKSAGGQEIVSRKKSAVPTTLTETSSKMITRQTALRSSMPVFSAAALRQGSKPLQETGTVPGHGDKKASKARNGADDLATLIAEHNRKFRPKPKYEPRIHCVKDIREWETRTGQLFYNLQPAERERVNQEISAAKHVRP